MRLIKSMRLTAVYVFLQGINRRSNTGSLAAQAPPTVLHSSSSAPSLSNCTELITVEHSVNRHGNADPLAAQAPPTVVHNRHGPLGKLYMYMFTVRS